MDKNKNKPLTDEEASKLDGYKHLLRQNIMMFYDMGATDVLQIPFKHEEEEWVIRIEKKDKSKKLIK